VENIILASLDDSGGDPPCGFRSSPSPTVVNNLAVPSARVIDALTNTDEASSPNPLTTFILGGRTQVGAATELRPTFASVWLGNNDALGPALQGLPNDGLLTDVSTFESRITQVVDSLTAAGAERGVLISVADPRFVPNFSTGQAYAAAESQINQTGSTLSPQWGSFSVDASCNGAGAQTRVPLQYGFQTLFQQALSGADVQLNCDPNTAPDPLLTPSEQNTISARVDAYNSVLSSLARDNDWAYLDINPVLQALYAANAMDADPSNDLVPKFPNFPDLQDPPSSPPTFGTYFSEDGIHPSSVTHRGVAFLVIEQLNARYDDVSLDQVSISDDELRSLLNSVQ
jgi:lysophospholipase L1-like esterase